MVSGNKIGAFSCSKKRVVFVLLCLYGVNQNFYYYWLIDRLIDWQMDWLIDRLNDSSHTGAQTETEFTI